MKSAKVSPVTTPAQQRRAARQGWEVRVFRGEGMQAEMATADEEFWLRIPMDERARVVWELSLEAFALAEPESIERRLPRSAFRLTRR
jgi:hypothetical protein